MAKNTNKKEEVKPVISSVGIRDRNIVSEMKESYINYSMSVIVSRALPDVRDGLKPVQRRIIYVMERLGIRYNTKHKKSAQTVGEVLGKYHPHGDVAVYDALVRMAQDFSMRMPLIDGQGNFGCFTKDTKVKLTDGRSLSFGDLIKEFEEGKKNWTYSMNLKDKRIEIAEIKNPRLTRKNAELVAITLDNDEIIRCTPNHKFMTKNGKYIEAKDLKSGQSLMPLYLQNYDGKEDTNLKNYLQILQPFLGSWEFVHHIADIYNLREGVYEKSAGRVRHHVDFNKYNNNPTNIKRLGWKEHWMLHANLASFRHKNDQEYVKKIKEGRDKYLNANKDLLAKKMSETNKKLWNKDEYRSKKIASIKERWATNQEYKEFMRNASSRNLKRLWKDQGFRDLFSKLKSEEMRKLWENADYRAAQSNRMRKISNNLWADKSHRSKMSQLSKVRNNDPKIKEQLSTRMKKQWKDEAFRSKYGEQFFSDIAKKLWENPETKKLHHEKLLKQRQDDEFISKQREGVKASNKKRMENDPEMMHKLAKKASISLKENWKDPEYKNKVMRSRILRYASTLLAKYGYIDEAIYEKERISYHTISIKKALQYFSSFEDIKNRARTYNHKVVSVKILNYREDVYDLTIDKWHNFALDSGIFVHNSIDGDSAAAMRYTEARLSKIADELTTDLEKETVEFVDNYDGTVKQPSVLPAMFPNLLVNGAEGIAVGMATKIPPHNLDEILSAVIYMIDKHVSSIDIKTLNTTDLVVAGFDSESTTEELMKFVKGPDFPTGAVIYDKKEIQNIYSLGKGKALMRAVTKIEETKNGRFQIIVTELPYQVNKAKLIEKVADLVKNGRIEGISDIRDESARGDIRVVIEIKREGNPNTVLNLLYKYTEMQLTFNANILALVQGEPRVLTLKNILELFVTHRQVVVIRRTEYELKIARARAHILEGLLIALDHLDEVIKTIRESETQEIAKVNLVTKFQLSDIQATAILDMQLRRLAALERQKIQDEYKEIMARIAEWEALLRNGVKILETIKGELVELKEKYPSPRRTKVIAGRPGEFSEEDLVKPENVIITLSQNGYVKRMPIDTYKTQNRGGKGVVGMTTKETDAVAHIIKANTHDDILFFTNKGRVYQVKAYDIPEFSRVAKGQAIINIINIEQGELVTSILTKSKDGFMEDESEIQEGEEAVEELGRNYQYLFMATKQGTVKKTKITDFEGIRKSGVIAIKLEANDELVWVKPTTGESEVLLVTSNAYSIKFNELDVRETGRSSMGVRGIKVKQGHSVIGMDIVRNGEGYVLIVSENGYGKMTQLSEYSVQGRGGQGVLTGRITDKTGQIVSMRVMDHPNKELLIVSRKGQAIRLKVNEISVLGRQTSGVRLMRLDNDDKVAEVACI